MSEDRYMMTVSTDVVIFGYRPDSVSLQVVLIRRAHSPYGGHLALPGGRVELAESVDAAALRELREETGLRPGYVEQLYTFSEPDRDPRGRVISVAYFALVSVKRFEPHAGSDASHASWFEVNDKLMSQLAFDHRDILKKGVERLRNKIRWTPIGFDLLPRKFTLGELRKLYETVLGRPLDRSNFRKKLLASGILTEIGETRPGVGCPPSAVYQFDKKAYDKAVKDGFVFEV